MLWNVMKTLDPTFRKNRFVLVGSSGAGKTCFLLRLGFYLACIKKQKILIIRRMKTNQLRNAVVYLDGNGCAIRKTNLEPGALTDFRSDPELKGAIVLLDGYPQHSVEGEQPDLLPFNILATTSEYDAKRSDPSHVVVLPAWHKEDLFRYAHETDWIDTPEIRNLAIGSSVSEFVSDQYYYRGGSLRDFFMDREELKDFVAAGCNSITDPKTYNLVSPFGGGERTVIKSIPCDATIFQIVTTSSITTDGRSGKLSWMLDMLWSFNASSLQREAAGARRVLQVDST